MKWVVAVTLGITLAGPVHAIEAGAPAPAIELAALRAGEAAIAMQKLKGGVVYVDFWASWCVPCRLSFPALDALQGKYAGRGFTVVGVNKDVNGADAERFLKRYPVAFKLAADADDRAAKAFNVKAMPSGYLIDRRGVVRHVHRGFTAETATALENEVEALLKEAS